jgi:hypothetical protein
LSFQVAKAAKNIGELMTRTQLRYAQSHRDDRVVFIWGLDGELVERLEDTTGYM